MRLFLAGLVAAHGLIHLFGFVKAFGLAPVTQLRRHVSRPEGALWFLCALLFLAAAAGVAAAWPLWWVPAAAGLVCSQWAIVRAWSDAKYGVFLNLILLVPVGLAMMLSLPGSFQARFREAAARPPATGATEPITEADLRDLPAPVQGYLRRAGVVGRPRVHSVRASFRGQIRAKVDGPWLPFTATQVDVFGPARRLFLIQSSMHGLPFEALHVYEEGVATMEVKLAGLVTVIDARGPEMNRSETVTFFNDLCVLAPAALLDAPVRWKTLDATHAEGTFTRGGQTVTAVLAFDETFDLVGFQSDNRLQTEDGKSYHPYRWSTPLSQHRDFKGVRLPAHGEASWAMPAGELVYGRFDLLGVDYEPAASVPAGPFASNGP